MIISASGRCDIPAFFSEWFYNRMDAGFLDIRNPFYPKQVSRIFLNPEVIDAIIFCTKNPHPMLKNLNRLKDYNVLFQVTITPYKKDVEPALPDKRKVIEDVKELSKQLGSDFVFVRYDPIFISSKYTVGYHLQMFERLCKQLEGYVKRIIVSFIDLKKNTTIHNKTLRIIPFTDETIHQLARCFVRIAKRYHMEIQSCAEKYHLEEDGFVSYGCIDKDLLSHMFHKEFSSSLAKKRDFCKCLNHVDIGAYNACGHFCKYCYANYDEKTVFQNLKNHDPNSSLLIGQLGLDDVVKVRIK